MSKNEKTLGELIDTDRNESVSKSPISKKKRQPFTKEEQLTLLKAIEIFGLEFTMISKMLPERTVAQIKVLTGRLQRKYKNMMRHDKQRVLEAVNKDKKTRTKYLLTHEISLMKSGSVQSNCSNGSIGKRLCRKVRELISTPSVQEAERKLKAIQEKKSEQK